MKRPVLLAVLASASLALAQRAPLPGLPVVPPPVSHPALIAQPLIDSGGSQTSAPAAPKAPKAKGKKAPQKKAPQKKGRSKPLIDPDTVGVKIKGRALKAAVKKVAKLPWHSSKEFEDMRAESAATGKPILFLQALGDIDGFA